MHISDDLYLGTAFVGGSNSSDGPSNMTLGVGPLGRFYAFDVVPVASGTTTGQNQLATTQQLTAATALTLTAGTGTTSSTDAAGNAIIVLDCERTVAFYSAADCSSATLTIVGYDRYGARMSQAVTGPNATTVQSTKCFKSILSITSSATVAQNIVAGLGTGIGLPFRVTDLGYLMRATYNQANITLDSTACKVADTTSPATTATTDVRGYIVVGQTDGSKRLVVGYTLPALAAGPNATRVGAVGVTQV